MSVTLISGVTGVGLSSICQDVRSRLGDNYTLINFGDVMLEEAAAHDITVQRDELSDLSRTQTRRLQRRAAEYVADQAERGDVLLSTHLAVETQAGYVHGLPDGVLHDVAPTAFVLVEAAPDAILNRRAGIDHDLDGATERKVEFEQHLNRTAALEYARERDAPIYFVDNDGSIDDAADHIATQL